MNKFTIRLNNDSQAIKASNSILSIDAEYYTVDLDGHLYLYAGNNHPVATFARDTWVGITETQFESLDAEFKEDYMMLLREHHQLLDISLDDLRTIQKLKNENEKLNNLLAGIQSQLESL